MIARLTPVAADLRPSDVVTSIAGHLLPSPCTVESIDPGHDGKFVIRLASGEGTTTKTVPGTADVDLLPPF